MRLKYQRMYAIAIDLDMAVLKNHYGSSHEDAHSKIEGVLAEHHFYLHQGSVYYGDESVTSVSAILAAQALSEKYDWFKPAVKDIRLLQLITNDDLEPVL